MVGNNMHVTTRISLGLCKVTGRELVATSSLKINASRKKVSLKKDSFFILRPRSIAQIFN